MAPMPLAILEQGDRKPTMLPPSTVRDTGIVRSAWYVMNRMYRSLLHT